MTLFNSICRKNFEERGGKNSHKCTNLFQVAIYNLYAHFFTESGKLTMVIYVINKY